MTEPAPDPCTADAIEQGCTCHVPSATAYDFDPPEPKRNKHCPLHGWAPDPDEAYERMRDDARDFPPEDWGRDDD